MNACPPSAISTSHCSRRKCSAAADPVQTFKLSWSLVNTSLTRLRLGRHGATLVTYNAWPHLEQADEDHLVTLR